ncbi:ParB/RepB/Spo0J family partition protein [Marivirga sp. S37H4]|uniref:ParB/RepB/Spo0J family partition protein n=1 Tax=Marivirga aurantiaca TaxID=2802615 RepID=A0A935CAC4_9BACT|nr:ParB/RepB/Spo0J family partition protein [Marivirga aurantiaca]MBK6264733.1 ParB/RepB/Spo0J family partition protein [Marivirga aurantiaca]
MAAKKPRKALGRGLSALLQDSETSNKSSDLERNISDVESAAGINEILISQIEVNPFQPRSHFDKEALEELAESIKVQGIIQPITVRKLSDDSYQLISGERRTQASKLAGLKKIPAYVRLANDQQMLEMALIENIQRENLNAMEIAISYQRLLTECNLKQEQLGDRVGKNRTTVNNYLRLLKLPPDIQLALKEKKISMGHARAIINIEDVDKQLDVFKKTINEDLSVRKVEALVRDIVTGKTTEKESPAKKEMPYEAKNVQNKLSSHFGTKVGLKIDGQNKGEIKIPFLSKDDLNRILDLLEVDL